MVTPVKTNSVIRAKDALRAALALVLLLVGLWIYQSIWGFGGVYTHILYIPVADTLLEDTSLTAFDFDAGNKHLRIYITPMSQADLVQFYREKLPAWGWKIVRAEYITSQRQEEIYCVTASQRNHVAFISIRESAAPPVRSTVIISLDKPELFYCHFQPDG